jgi:integrase
MRLYDAAGQRKYLTPSERADFLRAAEDAPPDVRLFCQVLAQTGCRVSEALSLTGLRIDIGAGAIVIESLKKRRKGVYRAVPIPPALSKLLAASFDLPAMQETRLWYWSRTTAWRRVREVMNVAGIKGAYASPKGLRHGFAIYAVASEVPLNMIQRWMGHSRLETTSIYANAVGPEERRIAERMWRGHDSHAIQPCAAFTFRTNACWLPLWAGPPPCAQFIAFRT